jgi:hypothetical protein
MKRKVKGVFFLIATIAILQSCSRSSCRGGSCPVFSEVEVNQFEPLNNDCLALNLSNPEKLSQLKSTRNSD